MAVRIASRLRESPADLLHFAPLRLWLLHERVREAEWDVHIAQVQAVEWGTLRALALALAPKGKTPRLPDLPTWEEVRRSKEEPPVDEQARNFFEQVAAANQLRQFW